EGASPVMDGPPHGRPLTPGEVRVAGALPEKALATADSYPMTLNALTAACNQKTGRDPVMDLEEREVTEALDALMRRGLAGNTTGAGARVEKYRHNLDRRFDLDAPALAVLAVLLLRGPQPAGGRRGRRAGGRTGAAGRGAGGGARRAARGLRALPRPVRVAADRFE